MLLENVEGAAEDLVNAVKHDPTGAEPTTGRAKGLLLEIKRQLDKATADSDG